MNKRELHSLLKNAGIPILSNPSSDAESYIIYCRESRDDYGVNYERIETQRDLCLRYCKDKGYYNIVDIIMQDDTTGTDFARYEELKQKIISREFDVLIMKDDSRFGRNQKESLIFLDLIQDNEIRPEFVTTQFNEDLFGLNAWYNERRAKDDSVKIRANLRQKMEQGKLLIRSHFGYNKVDKVIGIDEKGSEITKKTLVIDKEAAEVVKEIFDLYLQGYGYRSIANQLNDSKVPTPSQYKAQGRYPVASAWKSLHVQRILANQTYVGNMVSRTTEKVSFKSKRTRRLPKEQWIIIPDTHEAIISREIFDKVHKLIDSKSAFSPKSPNPSPFSGLITCGRCKSSMYMNRSKRIPDAFVCGKYFDEGKYKEKNGLGCMGHRTREDHLFDIVGKHLEKLQNEDFRKELEEASSKYESSQQFTEEKIAKTAKEIQALQNQYKQVYDDKLNGIIPEFIFIDKTVELKERIDSSELKLKELQSEKNKIDNGVNDGNKFYSIMADIKKNGLSRETIHDIIEKIIIYDEYEITENDRITFKISAGRYNAVFENGGIIIIYK